MYSFWGMVSSEKCDLEYISFEINLIGWLPTKDEWTNEKFLLCFKSFAQKITYNIVPKYQK